MTPALDNVDGDLIANDTRERMQQILVEQIKQLSGKLDTSRATTTHNKRQQAFALLVGGRGKTSQFHVLQDLVLDPASIVNSLQEVAMLQTLDAVRVRDAACVNLCEYSSITGNPADRD